MSTTCQQKKGISTPKSTATGFGLYKAQHYLQPLEEKLLTQIDKRLVATFATLFTSILLFRNSKMGLLLSELGSYITGYAHAPGEPSDLVICCALKNGTLLGSMRSFSSAPRHGSLNCWGPQATLAFVG